MPSKKGPPRVCWDANVFLSYVNGDEDRVPDIDALLDQAREGTLEIVTSTVTLVEVAFAATEQQGSTLNEQTEARIDQLWMPPSPIRVIEFTPVIARDARQSIRNAVANGWSLKPIDAIHLATATRMNVVEFHTYEKGTLDKYGQASGFKVGPPVAAQMQLPGTQRRDEQK